MDTDAARPRWRFNAAHRLTPRLSVGLEFNPAVSEVNPIANWIAHTEMGNIPMISFGTSSDRIFSPKGSQATYVTFAKGFPGTGLAPYVSISYSEFENRILLPFGVNVALNERIDLLPMNDGRRTHLLLTYKAEKANLPLMAIDLKRPRFGVSVGWGF